MGDPRTERTTPAPDLFAAVGRHLALFLAPIVILAGLGVAYGLVRKPVYHAEARVTIGQLNLTTQGLPGFVAAASNLAAAYARAVDAPEVTSAAAKAAGVSQARARDALSASGIVNTPLFRVEAQDTSKPVAIKLANAGANALIAHVLDLNRRESTRSDLLASYKSAAAKVASLRKSVRRQGRRVSDNLASRLQTAELRLLTIGRLYSLSAAGDVAQNLLQVVARADGASDDRKTTVERWGLIGALAGLLLGLALAAGRETSLQRRAAAAEPAPAPATQTTTTDA